jgi:hypothetical protein
VAVLAFMEDVVAKAKGTDFRKITRRQAVQELAAIEAHLRGLTGQNQTETFCLECIGKHISHLGALAQEGIGFFPEDAELWAKLGAWVEEILDAGEDPSVKVTYEMVSKWMQEARAWRKNLQAKYMGNFGKCQCVTGYEPCCHGKKRKAV